MTPKEIRQEAAKSFGWKEIHWIDGKLYGTKQSAFGGHIIEEIPDYLPVHALRIKTMNRVIRFVIGCSLLPGMFWTFYFLQTHPKFVHWVCMGALGLISLFMGLLFSMGW